MVEQRCETCRFRLELIAGTLSPCRRYPPTLNEHHNNVYPLVEPHSWCGEWQATEPATKDQALYALARLTLAGDLEAARAMADRVQELE